MTWTDPRTWSVGEVITHDDLNAQLRDNLHYLKAANPLTVCASDRVCTTTLGTWADIDAQHLSVTLTTNGGPLLVGFEAATHGTSISYSTYFDITLDGARQGGTFGLHRYDALGGGLVSMDFAKPTAFRFYTWLTGVAAGSHTLRPQWRLETDVSGAGGYVQLDNLANGGIPARLTILEVGQ